ncbi:hypothetical protein [Bacillus sp. REN3]|uniref:hypothetical protein n=1 Tax=Bacillus sp. REN3 TaxID=2802440 RepID=UPI001AEE32D7|nr:hypothetical protein [Bacillus sp. REN3]
MKNSLLSRKHSKTGSRKKKLKSEREPGEWPGSISLGNQTANTGALDLFRQTLHRQIGDSFSMPLFLSLEVPRNKTRKLEIARKHHWFL